MRKHFTVRSGGDPYSRAAEITEHVEHGDIFRGDLSGLRTKRHAESHLRRTYPGCRVTREA